MSLLETEALVLRVTPYSETSQVVRLLAPSGMMSALARGIKRPRSSLGGPLDILDVLEAEIRLRRGHDPLHALTRARRTRWFGELHRSLPAFHGAEYLREILLSIVTPEHDASETFSLAINALGALNDGHAPAPVGARFAASLLRLHGLMPELRHCVVTGEALDNGSPAMFSYREFGLIAAHAVKQRPDVDHLRPEVLEILRRIFEKDRVAGEFRLDLWLGAFTVCNRLMELGIGRQLRSAQALLEESRRDGNHTRGEAMLTTTRNSA